MPTATNFYYKVSGKGCIANPATSNCFTLRYDTTNSVYICESCLYGLTLSKGVCA